VLCATAACVTKFWSDAMFKVSGIAAQDFHLALAEELLCR
jgi:hypothetical protein